MSAYVAFYRTLDQILCAACLPHRVTALLAQLRGTHTCSRCGAKGGSR